MKTNNFLRLLALQATIILLSVCNLHAQDNRVTITGKVNRVSASTTVIIEAEGETFTAPVNKDGSFILDTILNKESTAFVKTDSSAPTLIWLTPGAYSFTVQEIDLPGIAAHLTRTPQFHGPEDAGIFNAYIMGMFTIEGREKQVAFIKGFIDSILVIKPACKALPDILQLGGPRLTSDDLLAYNKKINASGNNDILKDIPAEVQQREATKPGTMFTDFTMPNGAGQAFTFSSVKSKLTLVEYWSSWCAPCRANHKNMAQLYKTYHSKGLEIVSISLDDNKDDWQTAIAKDDMQWINVSDLKGWQTAIAKKYFVYAVPFHVWLDINHAIIKKEMNETEIAKILEE